MAGDWFGAGHLRHDADLAAAAGGRGRGASLESDADSASAILAPPLSALRDLSLRVRDLKFDQNVRRLEEADPGGETVASESSPIVCESLSAFGALFEPGRKEQQIQQNFSVLSNAPSNILKFVCA